MKLFIVICLSLFSSAVFAGRSVSAPAVKAVVQFFGDTQSSLITAVDCRNLSSRAQSVSLVSLPGSVVMLSSAPTPGGSLTFMPALDYPGGTQKASIPANGAVIFRTQMRCNTMGKCDFYGWSNVAGATPSADPGFVLDTGTGRLDIELSLYLRVDVDQDAGAIVCRATPYAFTSSLTATMKMLLTPTVFEFNGGRPF